MHRLEIMRLNAGLTRYQVEKATGISRQTIIDIENERIRGQRKTLARLAKFYKEATNEANETI